MPGLATRLKKSKSGDAMSTVVARRQTGEMTHNSRLHSKCNNTLRVISPPLSVTVSSTFGVENQFFVPRHCAAQLRPGYCGTCDETAIDFDVAYFYGDSPNTVSTGHANSLQHRQLQRETGRRDKQVLVPLLVAQWRNSIRRRVEGFEMEEQDRSFAATVGWTLISLQDALARDDIRRRDEGFELASEPTRQTPPYRDAISPVHGTSVFGKLDDLPTQPGNARLSSDLPTMPSVYSSDSWAENIPLGAHSLLSATASADTGRGTEASTVDSGDPDIRSKSSMDEASFMRMAIPLGW